MAKILEKMLAELYGRKIGFALFMFGLGKGEGSGTGDYVSNGRREDIIKFMRQIADRIERGQDIPRTVGQA